MVPSLQSFQLGIKGIHGPMPAPVRAFRPGFEPRQIMREDQWKIRGRGRGRMTRRSDDQNADRGERYGCDEIAGQKRSVSNHLYLYTLRSSPHLLFRD